MVLDIAVAIVTVLTLAGFMLNAFYNRRGTVTDDIRADNRRALNDTSRLVR